MKSKDLGDINPWSERNWVLVFDADEEHSMPSRVSRKSTKSAGHR